MEAPAADWETFAGRCAPQVAASTLHAVAKVESGVNPFALNVNGGWRLQRQPRDLREATAWLRWLVEHGHSADVGLMQVNTANFRWTGLTPDNAFDPCANLAAGARVLQDAYRRQRAREPDAQRALRRALSAYNTGHPEKGVNNGYVASVGRAAAAR